MNKPTAVIDKSLFQEICALESDSEREVCWTVLFERFQLVVPFVLLEEVLANVARPKDISLPVLKRMRQALLALQPCWIQDVFEIAFAELVEGHPLSKLPAPDETDAQHMVFLLGAQATDSALTEWAETRARDKKRTAQVRKAEQERLLASVPNDCVKDEVEFFQRIVEPEFVRLIQEQRLKTEFLEIVLGQIIRRRHPEAHGQIDIAFERYSMANFGAYPTTTSCLTVRLTYLFAPAVHVRHGHEGTPPRFLPGGTREQVNNPEDEQYLVSALNYDRLLTRDKGLANVALAFRAVGRWNGEVVFIEPSVELGRQLASLPLLKN